MSKTVLITGLSGFIAKHVALRALAEGHRVRGTVRDLATAGALEGTLERAGADLSSLELAQADLQADEGWIDAVRGVDYVLHIASPFPLKQPSGRLDLVPPARDGTLRVLRTVKDAGDSVERVVLTSSMAAMMYRPDRARHFAVREEDWTDIDWPPASAYVISKTVAERAAWEWARENDFTEKLAAINPGLVLGPALDTKSATSIEVIRLIMRGAYPALPPAYFGVVDVRDVAALQLAALTAPDTRGRRLIACESPMSMTEMAALLKQTFPERGKKIPSLTLPAAAVRGLALFDRSLKTVLADMNVAPDAQNEYVTELTGVRFRPAREAVIAAGQSLIDLGVV
ncbi:MAG: NAD-dependent epimerase/dehydratase family protein [Candidatus Eisenbacteria bacterium]|nr:NAD-dependent epimerase/dehydratase family protein [Candidatus Eisenbacteria bacterium]